MIAHVGGLQLQSETLGYHSMRVAGVTAECSPASPRVNIPNTAEAPIEAADDAGE